MVAFTSLLLPILLSAVAVFLVSSVLHMALPWHHKDWKRLPNEGELQDFLRKASIPPGDYMLPCPASGAGAKDQTFIERVKTGPNATMTLRAGSGFNMTSYLSKWFVYLLIVSAFCALSVAHAAGPGAENTHRIIHFTALPAFLAYSLASWQDTIWYSKSTATTIRYTIDAFLYAAVTAAVFVWMWPKH